MASRTKRPRIKSAKILRIRAGQVDQQTKERLETSAELVRRSKRLLEQSKPKKSGWIGFPPDPPDSLEEEIT